MNYLELHEQRNRDKFATLPLAFDTYRQIGGCFTPWLTSHHSTSPIHDRTIPYGMPAWALLQKANGIAIRTTGLTFIEGAEWRGFDDLGAPSYWNEAGNVIYLFHTPRHASGNVEYDGFQISAFSHDLFTVRYIAVPPSSGMRWRKAPTRSTLPHLPLQIVMKLNEA